MFGSVWPLVAGPRPHVERLGTGFVISWRVALAKHKESMRLSRQVHRPRCYAPETPVQAPAILRSDYPSKHVPPKQAMKLEEARRATENRTGTSYPESNGHFSCGIWSRVEWSVSRLADGDRVVWRSGKSSQSLRQLLEPPEFTSGKAGQLAKTHALEMAFGGRAPVCHLGSNWRPRRPQPCLCTPPHCTCSLRSHQLLEPVARRWILTSASSNWSMLNCLPICQIGSQTAGVGVGVGVGEIP